MALRSLPDRNPVAVFFCMPEEGHFKPLCPLISDLVRAGIHVYVFTHLRFKPDVDKRGGVFVDLFAKYPLQRADDESIPVPCRYVTFAGHYVEEVLRDLKELEPSIIVYETFSVIGRVVASSLGVPYINVSPNHNMEPARLLTALRDDPRVKISPSCHHAVKILRERHGLSDASVFSYVSVLSPYLNILCEPKAYLEEEEREVFQPFAIYGSLPSAEELRAAKPAAGPGYFSTFENNADRVKVYVSFGTVVWRYYASAALSALQAISDCLARTPEACAVISLGRASLDTETTNDLSRPNVCVLNYVDQWRILQEANVFVTHHGMNSTHEAVFHRVPMISYPFFGDQLMLADKCQQLGLAISLTGSERGPVSEQNVRDALIKLTEKRESLLTQLNRARTWELDVIAGRSDVLQKIMSLIKPCEDGSKRYPV